MKTITPQRLHQRVIMEGRRYLDGADPDVLDMFPAQRLICIEPENSPRKWPDAWVKAGGKLHGGQMIALKCDPIWRQISEFGFPYPPFDRYDVIEVEDVDRDEAERLNLIEPSQRFAIEMRDIQAEADHAVLCLKRPPPIG